MSAIQILQNLQNNPVSTHRSFKIGVDTYNCCHVVMVRSNNTLTIHGSGTKKFKTVVNYKPRTGNYRVSNKLYIGTTQAELITILAKTLTKLNAPPLPVGVNPKWAKGIFIRRNSLNGSAQNFQLAKNSKYFHQPFITFCQKNRFFCHIR